MIINNDVVMGSSYGTVLCLIRDADAGMNMRIGLKICRTNGNMVPHLSVTLIFYKTMIVMTIDG
ncbi:hypothetical protein D3C81_2283090 [compost metagenome]